MYQCNSPQPPEGLFAFTYVEFDGFTDSIDECYAKSREEWSRPLKRMFKNIRWYIKEHNIKRYRLERYNSRWFRWSCIEHRKCIQLVEE